MNLISSIINLKCSRCRKGEMFIKKHFWNKGFMKMYINCQECGLKFEREPGFFYGTGYISYGLTIAISVATFIASNILYDVSFKTNKIFIWLFINGLILLLLQPILMRLSRAIYLSIFVEYKKDEFK